MGRRSFIPTTQLNRLFSAKRACDKERERIQLINSQDDMRKELPPTYEITHIEINPKNRATKIEFLRSQQYRTIARYVTQNYVKYPILSEWKIRTRVIKKSIKLTNEELEKLNRHSDEIIRENATAIILALNDEELFPSWFLREMYQEEYSQKTTKLNEEFEEFKDNCQRSITSYKNIIYQHNEELIPLKLNLTKKTKKLEKLKTKITKIESADKKPFKYIASLYLYAYFVSQFRKNKLENKRKKTLAIINDLNSQIIRINSLIEKNKGNIYVLNENIDKSERELKDNLKLAQKEFNEKLHSITPLLYEEKLSEPQKNQCNEPHITMSESNTELEDTPDYLIEKQKALDYVNKYEGIETDEGEHYFKLAMKYFLLEKACYRPKLIENLEKYLISKPYVAIYQNYIVPLSGGRFTTYPKCENEMELAERNFLREIYYFLARAYEQEGDTENAFKYLELGMDIIPEGQQLFIFELFHTCKKANKLPEFIEYCENNPPTFSIQDLIVQAKNLIDSGYVYKHRKKTRTQNT